MYLVQSIETGTQQSLTKWLLITDVTSSAQNQASIRLSLILDLIMLFQDDKIKQGEARSYTGGAGILDKDLEKAH